MQVSDSDLVRLVRDHPGGLCVSLYMPTHRAGREKAQDPIRLRNMICFAERRMRKAGLRIPAVREVIQPARDLIRKPGFWRHPDNGVAIFLSPDIHLHYHLPIRPPRTLLISRRFYLKPLVSILSEDDSFCLLTLSLKAVKAYWGNRGGIVSTDGAGLPRSMAVTLPTLPPPQQLQWHTRTGDTTRGGKRAAIFHGQGGAKDFRGGDILRFFRQVDRGMRMLLRNRRMPLVVAGVDYLLPIYRKVNSYPYLSAVIPLGNPERMEAGKLHDFAWHAVQPILVERKGEAFRSFRRLAGAGDGRISSDIAAVLPAAFQGKVKTLFVDSQARVWGIFEPATQSLRYRPAADEWAEDLFDLAAVQVHMHGGEVFVVPPEQMPANAGIAAEFRL
jgi:hypothetical protein